MCVSGRFKKIFRQQGWVHPSTGTAPIRHLDRSRVKRKIQLEFLPHIPLTFHKDFQKPDSQPETKTLWAEKKKTLLRHHFRPAAGKRANTEKNARASGAYGPKCASARKSPAPSRSRQREARASEINSRRDRPRLPLRGQPVAGRFRL